jgi:hypothetical protein
MAVNVSSSLSETTFCAPIDHSPLPSCVHPADDLHAHLNKFGLRFERRKPAMAHPVSGATKQENEAVFGHANPVAALLEQKFLKCTTENGPDGTEEEWFTLGDAATGEAAELEAAACAEEIQALVRD